MTSGIVSPSELPDSPTQTVPPSPKQPKGPMEFPSSSRTLMGSLQRTPADGKSQPSLPRVPTKPSVFEDNITKFKEESTPIEFSTATSLSSLTIDDNEEHGGKTNTFATRKSSEKKIINKNNGEIGKSLDTVDLNDDIPQASESEEDEDILAACINDGMQNNRFALFVIVFN